MGMLPHIDEREFESWVIEKRREFHRIPELSFREFETQKKVMEILHDIGLEGSPIADTGVIATIQGKYPGSSIAIRAEMDGLEVTEEITHLNRKYISQHHGFMHSCGHDGHIAIVLGAAKLLMHYRDFLSGSVRLIFQPGEEQPPGGALDVIKKGGLEGVDAILGMHIFSIVNSGEIKFRPGLLLASANVVSIKIKGKGGHYARPEISLDPILIASRFIYCIHAEIKKAISDERFILGFGKIGGGASANRVPDEVEILGSFRTFDHNDTKFIEEIMKRTLNKLMDIYRKPEIPGLPKYELDILHGYPVLVNDPVFSMQVFNLLKDSFPAVGLDIDPNFGADDFAYYLEKVPGVYLLLGTKNEGKGITEGNHSSRFEIDENILMPGVRIITTIVLDFLKSPGKYILTGDKR
jgi:amidohydrolase